MTDVINTKQLEDVFKSVEANTKYLVDASATNERASASLEVMQIILAVRNVCVYMCVCVFVCVKEIESERDQERVKEPLIFRSLAHSRFTVIIFHFFSFFLMIFFCRACSRSISSIILAEGLWVWSLRFGSKRYKMKILYTFLSQIGVSQSWVCSPSKSWVCWKTDPGFWVCCTVVVDYGEKLQSINEGIVARYPFLWVRLPQKSMNSKSTAFDMEICVNFVLCLFFFGNDYFFPFLKWIINLVWACLFIFFMHRLMKHLADYTTGEICTHSPNQPTRERERQIKRKNIQDTVCVLAWVDWSDSRRREKIWSANNEIHDSNAVSIVNMVHLFSS